MLRKALATTALVAGMSLGGYGIAAAASGTSTQSSATTTTMPSGPPPGATASNPWGAQRSDETPLTGDALTRVKAAALAKVGSDATVVRVETDADGHAKYEAHMLRSDGTPATVYVDASFDVVSVEPR